MGDYTFVSANIRSNPIQPEWAVAHRIGQALDACGQGGVAIFQEMRPSNKKARAMYERVFKEECAKRGFTYRGLDTETPIAMSWRHWKVLAQYWVVLPKSWRTKVSPVRGFMNVAATRGGHMVSVSGQHPVSKGYEGARHRATAWLWRHAQLLAYQSRIAKEIASFVALGYVAVTGGDCNDPNPPKPNPNAVTLVSSGLDHLWATAPRGKRITNVTHYTIPKTRQMDHPIIVGSFDIA